MFEQPAPIVIVTRLGIGVYDLTWWKVRLSLFEAITLPSLIRFSYLDIKWFLLLDSDIPPPVLEELFILREKYKAKFLEFHMVPYQALIHESFYNVFKSQVFPGRKFIAGFIDDDDAISIDFFPNVFEALQEDPQENQIVTAPFGLALDAPNGRIGKLRYPSNRSNTIAFGDAFSISELHQYSHAFWLRDCEKVGFLPKTLESKTKQFLYTYHRQGDGDYQVRINRIRDWQPLEEEAFLRFGIDLGGVEKWIAIQSKIPSTLGLTWRRTQPEQERMVSFHKSIERLKGRSIRTNSKLFNSEIPFIYTTTDLYQEVVSGDFFIKGVCTPGKVVRLEKIASDGLKEQIAAIESDRTSGEYSFQVSVLPGECKFLISLMDDHSEPIEYKSLVIRLQVREQRN